MTAHLCGSHMMEEGTRPSFKNNCSTQFIRTILISKFETRIEVEEDMT